MHIAHGYDRRNSEIDVTDKQEESSPPASTDDPQAGASDPRNTSPAKTYKKPTISRHGNLRLMTQLE